MSINHERLGYITLYTFDIQNLFCFNIFTYLMSITNENIGLLGELIVSVTN